MPDRVIPFRSTMCRSGNASDAAFFENHPERRNRVRMLDAAEGRQARCLHGDPPAGRCYMLAVRLVTPGLFHRRFVLNGPGDGSEHCCRETFEYALIAGAPPRPEPDASEDWTGGDAA